jgi:hypothetical protein
MKNLSLVFISFQPINPEYILQVKNVLKIHYNDCKIHASNYISLLFEYTELIEIPIIYENIGKIIEQVENPNEISFKIHEIS